ncbi:hypothetical protein BJ973_003959 [Actinoplanes tereljensis]|uniref:Uncharacterized protein n=1 Tax=Paractinoplanes tereljensis TaxID=571912 RepID=A0A919NWT0_9ACTN|nr:hypothetical protein [Actinoplanes tereljensis]GIF25680.1 hypothetical protein Ate02nite_84100 [Actinoplanes tereljensis]
MRVEVTGAASLVFDDGAPVRAASAIAAFGDGWLIAQDDATHAAWWRGGSVTAVRVVEPVDGLEVFSEAAGTKHLKPDFEAACAVPAGVLLLGSGSTAARMRASLVSATGFTATDLTPVYHDVAAALGIAVEALNLEGACLLGDRLRWFQRGNPAAGAPTAGVDVDAAALIAAAESVKVGPVHRYDLGRVGGVALGVTDAVALADGRVLVSAAAEDTPNAVDDGPVAGAALALLDDDGVVAICALPGSHKVEGLAISATTTDGLELIAVVDADDPAVPSERLTLRLWW